MQHQDRGWLTGLSGFILGTAVHLQQRELLAAPLYLACLGLALPAIASRLRRRALLLALACALAAFGVNGLRAGARLAQALASDLEGRDLRVTGVVAAMPQQSEQGLRFRFEVEAAEGVRLPPRIYLGWYRGAFAQEEEDQLSGVTPELRAGERWRFTVRLKAPHGNSNPHGFDYELWLWEQGLQATGYVRDGPHDPAPERLGAGWGYSVERARQAVRDAIYRRIADPRLAGVVAALVVGDQSAIERADWEVFRATGVAHLMSISGLHITMFAWVAALCVGGLWRRSARLCLALPAPNAALLGGVALATLYALFSGWGVPSQRTVWMLAVVAALQLSGRRWPWSMVWLLAMAVVVAIDPWALLQAGFWLSFVAVGALFASALGETRDRSEGGRLRRFVRTLAAGLREQWVVTLALTPLTLLLFQQVSLVGLLANALAIPWVTLVLTPLAMLGIAWAPLWDAAGVAVRGLSVYLEWLAALPFASISAAAPPLWAGAAGVLGGLLLAMRLPWRFKVLGLPLLLPALLWQPARPAFGQFELLAADIGQGNAVLLRTAGHSLLYDTGPRFSRDSDAGQRTLVPLLRALGERLDRVVLSHRDADHTGGARAVLTMQPAAGLLSSLEDGHELLALRPGERCVAGQRWNWDGVDFEVLHPAPGVYGGRVKPNAVSCVLRIRSRDGASALLAGDIELAQETSLVAAGVLAPVDVLLVPHHGSKTSSSAAFLDAVQPRWALVQAGYRNRFGHPAPPVLARYRERGIGLVDSPHCGAARWTSAEPAVVRCQRETERRYWQHRPE